MSSILEEISEEFPVVNSNDSVKSTESKKDSEAALSKKSTEKQSYGYNPSFTSEVSSKSSSSSESEEEKFDDLEEKFKSLLDYSIKEKILDDATSEHKKLIDSVVDIVESSEELDKIHKIIKSRLSDLRKDGYEPRSLTVGSFFFGSYLEESYYYCENKYHDPICAFSLPKFSDENQTGDANVFYFKNRNTHIDIDNGSKVGVVHLGNEYKDLEDKHVDKIKEYGCEEIIVYRNGKHLRDVVLSRNSSHKQSSHSPESEKPYSLSESEKHCSLSDSEEKPYSLSELDSKCSSSSRRKTYTCSKSISSCPRTYSLSCESKKYCERKGSPFFFIIFIIIIIIIAAAVGRRYNRTIKY